MNEIKRGDIYYIHPEKSIGSEQNSGRPAVIVSNDENNKYSRVFEVVYLTTQDKEEPPTYVPTRVFTHATEPFSSVLCEQVHSVEKRRIGNYCGRCSESELREINIALAMSLGITEACAPTKIDATDYDSSSNYLIAVESNLELIQTMYEKLLDKIFSSKAHRYDALRRP